MAKAPFEKPSWVCEPKLGQCGLLVKKGGSVIDTLTQIQSSDCVTFGRNAQMCDVTLEHQSISRRHAMIAHGSSGNIYVVDLGSSHGTFVNGEKLTKHRRRPLKHNDVIKFGVSTRDYLVKLDLRYEDPPTSDVAEGAGHTAGSKRTLSEATASDTGAGSESSADSGKVECSHILIKHSGSRRPHSWKEKTVTRSKEEAIEELQKIRQRITLKSNTEGIKLTQAFGDVAECESHCNSYRKRGSLGRFGYGKMQKPFERAAFGLAIGEMSDVIETKSGVHIIIRTG